MSQPLAPSPKVQIIEEPTRVAISEVEPTESDEQLANQADSSLSIGSESTAASASAPTGSLGSASAASAASSSTADAVALSAPFHLLSDCKFALDTHAAVRRYYSKWNIDHTCAMHKWRYTQAVDLNAPASLHAFLVSFCNSPAFRSSFRRYNSSSRSLEPLPSAAVVSAVQYQPLRATLTDLHLFDRLWTEEPSIVYGSVEDPLPSLEESAVTLKGKSAAAAAAAAIARDAEENDSTSSGAIRKCFEDVIDGVPVADELRRALLDRDADSFEMFTPAERQELLFVLLTHLAVGGGLCQYENNVRPYLAVARLLYRDLVSVRTNRNTDRIEVASIALRVTGLTQAASGTSAAASALPLFGSNTKDKHHLCLLTIDPHKRHITCYYFAHTSAW